LVGKASGVRYEKYAFGWDTDTIMEFLTHARLQRMYLGRKN